ncbi:MAG: ABC transporter ATP-binding protein [Gemmatimonadales bacterium]
MSTAALRIEGLSAPFGSAPGLEDLSFEVQSGERFVLLGASGAGKTTLLRAIAGLAPAAARRMEVAGYDVAALPPERRDVVYLHQTPLLFPHLTVGRNVGFPLRVRKVPAAQAAKRVEEALSAVHLESFADRMPHTLSGGQRHRVALARAIIARPAVLLLDEPFASLDPSLRQEVREAVLTIQREYGPALVLVTHDLDEAGLLGDQVGVLLRRRLAQVDRPAQLFARPTSLEVARFLGMPNEVVGRIAEQGCFESVLGVLRVSRTIAPGPSVALFRPEAVRICERGFMAAPVVALRHRVHQTTAIVEVGGTRLEVALGGARAPAAHSLVQLSIDPDQLMIFPAP